MDNLTLDQKKFIDDNWDKLRLPDLIKRTFGNNSLDGRSQEGRLVKEYLGDRQVATSAHIKKESIELSEEQKEYVRNNSKTSTATEIARILFNNNSLSTLSLESRAVLSYLKTLPKEITGKSYQDDTDEEYKSPNTIRQMMDRINECTSEGFEYDKLNSFQRKMFEKMISFLKSPRFLQMMNSYTSKASRNMFESEFIRTVFDKQDLTSDELNLCINLCSNYLQMINVNKHLSMLNDRYEQVVSDPDNKLSMTLAEMITAKTREFNECDGRQQKIIKDLQGSRAERNKNKTQETLSIAGLIEWWRDEETRKKGLALAEMKKSLVTEEVGRLVDMDEIRACIIGLNISELVNG